MELERGQRVKVMVDGRHDFVRGAQVLRVNRDGSLEIVWDNGMTENIPERWVRNTVSTFQ